MTYDIEPIGVVRTARTDPGSSDAWGAVESVIVIADRFPPECLSGLAEFSHVEVIYVFDQALEREDYTARRPRGRADLPLVGVFADRGPRRPNRIGATICKVAGVAGRELHTVGLDAVDGTPVLDLKPVMTQFLPTAVRQPAWVDTLMAHYFDEEPPPNR